MRLLALLCAAALSSTARAYDNGAPLGQFAPRGWSSWCTDDVCGLLDLCFESEVMAIADAMVSSGLVTLDYSLVLLDGAYCKFLARAQYRLMTFDALHKQTVGPPQTAPRLASSNPTRRASPRAFLRSSRTSPRAGLRSACSASSSGCDRGNVLLPTPPPTSPAQHVRGHKDLQVRSPGLMGALRARCSDTCGVGGSVDKE